MTIKVRVGQQNGIRVKSSISGSAGGFAVLSENVVGGIGSLSELSVSGYSSFAGVSTFSNDVYIDGNLTVGNDFIFDQFSAQEINTQRLVVSGVSTTNSLNIGEIPVISNSRQLQNIASLDEVTTSTIESAISNTPNIFTDLEVTGVSTFGGDIYYTNGNQYGIAYFSPTELIESTLSPENGIDYTNNILTIDDGGIPSWSNALDGGEY